MRINQIRNIPIIYLTANSDNATFLKAKASFPKAFITKPFNKLNLQRTISLVLAELKKDSREAGETSLEVLKDRIFVRHNGKMKKLLLLDILYVEADRNYCTIVTSKETILLSTTLKVMEEKLPKTDFMRVHRSYMVNVSKLDVIGDNYLEINRKVIPFSKSHKEMLMERIKTI